jgi:hypothetical protein
VAPENNDDCQNSNKVKRWKKSYEETSYDEFASFIDDIRKPLKEAHEISKQEFTSVLLTMLQHSNSITKSGRNRWMYSVNHESKGKIGVCMRAYLGLLGVTKAQLDYVQGLKNKKNNACQSLLLLNTAQCLGSNTGINNNKVDDLNADRFESDGNKAGNPISDDFERNNNESDHPNANNVENNNDKAENLNNHSIESDDDKVNKAKQSNINNSEEIDENGCVVH